MLNVLAIPMPGGAGLAVVALIASLIKFASRQTWLMPLIRRQISLLRNVFGATCIHACRSDGST